MEAWNVTVQNQLWEAAIDSGKAAILALNTPGVNDIRNRTASIRNRKTKSIKSIKRSWPTEAQGL